MIEKIEVLFVIAGLLLVFYLVISFGAGNKRKASQSIEIKKYLFGVRMLILLIALVSVILWMFL